MTITLTREEKLEYFHNAICNALAYVTSSYDLALDYNEEVYSTARAKLIREKPNELICIEDILMRILEDGGTLSLVDEDGSSPTDPNSCTLEEVLERMDRVPVDRILQMYEGNDDAETADVIIQHCFFNEIVFG